MHPSGPPVWLILEVPVLFVVSVLLFTTISGFGRPEPRASLFGANLSASLALIALVAVYNTSVMTEGAAMTLVALFLLRFITCGVLDMRGTLHRAQQRPQYAWDREFSLQVAILFLLASFASWFLAAALSSNRQVNDNLVLLSLAFASCGLAAIFGTAYLVVREYGDSRSRQDQIQRDIVRRYRKPGSQA